MTDEIKTQFSSAIRAVRVTDFVSHKDYLQAIFTVVKAEQRRYSYLQFAEDLGFSKTNVMHLIINGRRPLTSKAGARIIKALNLSGVHKRYFETLVNYANADKSTDRELLFQELLALKNKTLKSALAQNQLEFFQEWFYPVIFEMLRRPDFASDGQWIASQLRPRVRPEQARRALDLLETLGLARYDAEKRRHVPVSQQLTTGAEIASLAVTRYHQRMIDLGKEAVTNIDEQERDISAITICVSAEMAAKIKREVQEFRRKILALADEDPAPDRVHQLNIQFFPVTGKRS